MKKDGTHKVIDGIIWRPCWKDTFKAMKPGDKIKLRREQMSYGSANCAIRSIQREKPQCQYSITALDRYQDEYIVTRN